MPSRVDSAKQALGEGDYIRSIAQSLLHLAENVPPDMAAIVKQMRLTQAIERIELANDGGLILWLEGRTEPVFYIPGGYPEKRTKAKP